MTDLLDGLEEPAVAVELRIKIDQNHADLKGRYAAGYGITWMSIQGLCIFC